VGPRCHRDGEESGAVPNIFGDLRSAVELLHGGDLWICSFRAIFLELELSQTRPKFVKSGFWTKRTPIDTIYAREEGSTILTMLYPPKLMMH
jgi:hypothetical protein